MIVDMLQFPVRYLRTKTTPFTRHRDFWTNLLENLSDIDVLALERYQARLKAPFHTARKLDRHLFQILFSSGISLATIVFESLYWIKYAKLRTALFFQLIINPHSMRRFFCHASSTAKRQLRAALAARKSPPAPANS